MSAGITGHQDLGDQETRRWVVATLRAEILRRPFDVGLTSLAVGADQVFAEVLLEAGIPYEVVLPCARYEETFSAGEARARFQALLERARGVHELPFAQPSQEAFFEAGKRIALRCEVLFAVWNGLPARGLGGTGDVVGYARSLGRSLVHINPVTRAVTALEAGEEDRS